MARDGRLVDRAPLQSDAELLRAIRDDLHIVYDVILQRPPPNTASCTFDSSLTMVQGKNVKVIGWYDNEWGYSNRLVDLTVFIGGQI
jgi:glyceraldehyde-3-phosphate dehydrogenase/erythrose-4-phosphate dehydrogenase